MRFAITILFAMALAGTTEQPKPTTTQDTAVVFSKADIAKLLETQLPGPKIYGGGLKDAEHFRIGALRREAPGEVEVHRDDNDVFYILAGEATLITGGKALETKQVSPKETIGKSIQGGVAHTIRAGDVVVIPKQQPHWFQKVGSPISYIVIKVQ
jgi:mannose-6-phosphate isomerase-like protein (cupin superfamily)